MSVQYFAVASQKLTRPGLTALPPDVTVAVSVTTVPDPTEVTGLPAALTESDVTVAAVVAVEAPEATGAAQTSDRTKASPTAALQAPAAEEKWNEGFEAGCETARINGME
jgi:hypothetical protein